MLTYEKWISSSPPAENAPWLVLLSGVHSGVWFYEPGRKMLTQHFNVLAVNNPGVAKSSTQGIRTVRDIARKVALILKKENINTYSVLGHSMGGFIAQELALLKPPAIENLILVSTSMGQPYMAQDLIHFTKSIDKSWQQFNRDVAKTPEMGLQPLLGKSYLLEKPIEFQAFAKQHHAMAPSKADSHKNAAVAVGFSSFGRINSIKTRTLVVHGDVDALITPRSSKTMAENLPNASYWELLGIAHYPSLEHPNFWHNIVNFLQGETLGVKIEHTPPFTRSTQNIRKYWENLLWPTK